MIFYNNNIVYGQGEYYELPTASNGVDRTIGLNVFTLFAQWNSSVYYFSK